MAEQLPEHMVPQVFMRLEALPLTPNGKIDRRALPEPGRVQRGAHLYVAPATPLEQALCETVATLLGQERVGMNDSFFDLGGHSLKAVQLINQVNQRHGIEVPVMELFKNATMQHFARVVEQEIVARQVFSAPTDMTGMQVLEL